MLELLPSIFSPLARSDNPRLLAGVLLMERVKVTYSDSSIRLPIFEEKKVFKISHLTSFQIIHFLFLSSPLMSLLPEVRVSKQQLSSSREDRVERVHLKGTEESPSIPGRSLRCVCYRRGCGLNSRWELLQSSAAWTKHPVLLKLGWEYFPVHSVLKFSI